jgi:NAD(P)-dependent dehydrogenase (short-subunit alcohol dehydrogenase family)
MGHPQTDELFGLVGAVAVVTGATGAIGHACAQRLLLQGASVIVVSRRTERAAQAVAALAPYGAVDAVVGDLGGGPDTIAAIAAAIAAKTGRVNILVNNAGAAWAAPLADYPDRAWQKILTLDTVAPFQLVQELLPLLESAASADNPARVINIGSVDGTRVGPFENFAYSAAKAALHHLTVVLAHHLGKRNITVNCVAPGPVRTRMTETILKPHEAALVEANPLSRLATPLDIAGPVAFLASRAAAYITGAIIPVDGGYSTSTWAGSPPPA